MPVLNTLQVKTDVDNKKLTRGLKKADQEMRKTADRGVANFKRLAAGINPATLAMGALTAAAVGGAAALIKLQSSAAGYASEILRSARETNQSVEEIQRLRFAARLAGVEFDDANEFIKDFADRVGDASYGTATWVEHFKNAGVEVTRMQRLLDQGNILQALTEYSEALEKLPRSRRVFLTQEVSPSGAAAIADIGELAPLLEVAKDLNVVGEEALKRQRKLNSVYTILTESTLAGFSEAFGINIDNAEEFAAKVRDLANDAFKAGNALAQLADFTLPVLQFFADLVGTPTPSGRLVEIDRRRNEILAALNANRLRHENPDNIGIGIFGNRERDRLLKELGDLNKEWVVVNEQVQANVVSAGNDFVTSTKTAGKELITAADEAGRRFYQTFEQERTKFGANRFSGNRDFIVQPNGEVDTSGGGFGTGITGSFVGPRRPEGWTPFGTVEPPQDFFKPFADDLLADLSRELSTALREGNFDDIGDIFADTLLTAMTQPLVDITSDIATGFLNELTKSFTSGIADDAFENFGASLARGLTGFLGGLSPFHEGGVVPGRTGQEVPILAQAGEVVLTPEQASSMSAGGETIVVNFNITGNIDQASEDYITRNANNVADIVQRSLKSRNIR